MSEKSLEDTFHYLSELGSSIEPLMLKFLLKDIHPDFQDLISWQTETGGKRLRPALVILFAQAFGVAQGAGRYGRG